MELTKNSQEKGISATEFINVFPFLLPKVTRSTPESLEMPSKQNIGKKIFLDLHTSNVKLEMYNNLTNS